VQIRKYHPHKSVLFVTFSIEQGLLLLANPLCQAIVKSCLARAQFKYPVRISAFIINANHVHLVMVVDNPDNVTSFIQYFKTESAHMLNRVLGRRKRTIWCKGFDSPVVLTYTRTLIALSYLYANPAKDNLEENIEQFPGLSSWEMFISGKHTKHWKRLKRPAFKMLAKDSHNLRGYSKEAQRILSESKKTHEFTLSPNAWMEAFNITDSVEHERINKRIIQRVRTLEQRAAKIRERLGKKVMGRDKLISQSLNLNYQSNRSGKKMHCLSDDIKLRVEFIEFLKDLYAKARDVLAQWRQGNLSARFPLGLYPPCMPKLAEPLGLW
jgi:REP element-mobilizing transposase RayT